MVKSIHPPEPREAVERALGKPLPDEAWAQAVEDGWERDIRIADLDPAEVARRLRRYGTVGAPRSRAFQREASDGRIPGAELLNLRGKVLGAWSARAARTDHEVRAFRRIHLRTGLLQPNAVHKWVVTMYRANLPKEWPVTGDPVADADAPYRAHLEVRQARHAFIDLIWAEPDGEEMWQGGRWPVPLRSPLGRLAGLSEKLAEKWKWTAVEATLFVLTDRIPFVSPITGRSSVGVNFHADMWGSHDVFSRVTIELDPTVSPEQLAAWWRGVRRRMLSGDRYRALGHKHLELARFMSERDESTSWEDDRKAWNRAHARQPTWKYEDRRNFHRDAVSAVRRLLLAGIRTPAPLDED